ncbi:magnetosome magnetite formation protein MamP [Magnetovibrio sp. PR-2]|uniref:magnetosome magnetite formation protein MamP n=1 Tax=Magnetovibrio sp. PR-2 TaxID=3120356 RepID=UPI002FCE44EE
MVDKKILIGAVGAIAIITLLSTIFDSEVHHSNMSSAAITGQAGVANQIGGPGMWATPNNNLQTPPASQQAPGPNVPTIVNVATGSLNPGAIDTARIGGNVPNFLPSNVQLSEGHWQGMDVGELSSELRRKLRYPRGLKGLLVDEVTLNSARSGLKAGDVIVNVGNVSVTTLEAFQQSSRMVRNLDKVELTALRKGERGEDGRYSMRRVSVFLRGDPDLGFAQLESAPMILPGDGRPHPHRGACTNCHSIGSGFELPDPDLITLPPPPITHAVVVQGILPHRDRGPCEACHQIVK